MSTNVQQLKRRIMRRIYLAYGRAVLAHPMMLHGMLLSVSVGVFAQQVHVASLISNLLHTEVGNLPQFIWNAFARGEILTVAVVGVMIFTLLSVQWRLIHLPRWRGVSVVN